MSCEALGSGGINVVQPAVAIPDNYICKLEFGFRSELLNGDFWFLFISTSTGEIVHAVLTPEVELTFNSHTKLLNNSLTTLVCFLKTVSVNLGFIFLYMHKEIIHLKVHILNHVSNLLGEKSGS